MKCLSYSLVLVVFALVGFQIDVILATNEQYRGDRLVKMTPHTQQSMDAMNRYFRQHNFDVWYPTIQVNKPCGVRISQKDYTETKRFCQEQNIDFEVSINDLKNAIDQHIEENGGNENDDEGVDDDMFWDDDFSSALNYTRYNRYDDIVAELFRLRHKFPYNIRTCTVGHSHEGRPLKVVIVTKNIRRMRHKPIIWIEAGAHGREWISPAAGIFMIRRLLEGNKKGDANITKLLKEHVIYFVPVFNPDGYEYTFTDARLWRKTRTNFNGPECIGADPNRNWDSRWNGTASSTDPCSITYRGVSVESEPCVSTYARCLRSVKPRLKAYFSLHSFLQLLLIPNSYTTTLNPNFRTQENLAKVFAAEVRKRFNTDYAFAPAPFLIGFANGVSADYVHDKLGTVFSYTVELRDRGQFGFLLPPNQIEPVALETLDAIVASVLAINSL